MGTPDAHRMAPRAGQVVLAAAATDLGSTDRVRGLHRLSDPVLSELGLDEFLDELLVRVRDALEVDTVAILLLDAESQQLVARAAKGIEEEVELGVRIPIGKGFAGRIAAERVAIFIADVDHADVVNPILREKGIRSLLGLPLIVQGDLIGVLHVGSLVPREFGARDLALLQVAAARAAPGIERARLFSALQHERRAVMSLQRSLLPPRLPPIVGIRTDARYLPASDEVGGDWYDIFELSGGRVGIAIGDVVGHGIPAAGLMGQLRAVLHAYALQEDGPAHTLEMTDRYVQTMSENPMATVAFAELDPATGRIQLASAGHLPPMLISRDGARIVAVKPQAPLGSFAYTRRTEHELQLDPGEILVLYTDGLIERPGIPLTESMDELLATIRGAATVEEVCALAVDYLPLQGLRDDVAIVALESTEIPEELDLEIAAEPARLAGCRHHLRRWLIHAGVGSETAAEIVLAAGEACSNAVEHAYSPGPATFGLRACARDGAVTIVVTDTGRWRPARGHDRGRGLSIIRMTMDEVEVHADERGTRLTMIKRLAS